MAPWELEREPGALAETRGGGYGSPLERDPARVKHDLDEGWISRERAEAVYGLALAADGSIDLAATQARRAAMASLAR